MYPKLSRVLIALLILLFQIDLATALGIEVPDVSGGPKARALSKRR